MKLAGEIKDNFKKEYSWTSPFLLSNIAKFTLKVSANPDEKVSKQVKAIKDVVHRKQTEKFMNGSHYLRVSCSQGVGQNMGSSIFVVVRDEPDDAPEYLI